MKRYLVNIFVIFAVSCWLVFPVAANEITIVGEVNDNLQIVADNKIYDVADNPIGDDLVRNYIAQKVKVVGQLKETDELPIITVISFEVVEE